jgi:hypothetical protein
MRADLTHPWGTKHRPNSLHRPWLTPGDEAPELSLRLDTFSGQGHCLGGLYIRSVTKPGKTSDLMTPKNQPQGHLLDSEIFVHF